MDKQEIKGLLEDLGNDVDEVVMNLEKLDYKGARGIAESCPVANYLKKELSEFPVYLEAEGSGIYVEDQNMDVYKVPTTPAVKNFINNFDKGYYEFLEV